MEGFKKSLLVSLWFMFLVLPIMGVFVDSVENVVIWRLERVLYVGICTFFLSYVWRFMIRKKEAGNKVDEESGEEQISTYSKILSSPSFYYPLLAGILIFAIIFPQLFSMYQVNIMISALIYVVLGLGLNIVVGLAGLLDLGYVAFYAVGAYSYALMNLYWGVNFWVALPVGALLGALCGILLGFPVLRLRGDYLAIVTLGFGEIIRLVLENWGDFTHGPSGIANIPRPDFFGLFTGLSNSIHFMYYLMIVLVIFTIFVVNRLKNSRIGRAWQALREDEIACQAMGIDKVKTKLMAFSLGATWAGLVGVVFAAKTSFINPASFTFLESAIILSIVVLGGMGSILGVILGALVLILLPEYLRAFSEYRMLIFGATMVLVMVFRPQGLIRDVRQKIDINAIKKALGEANE
ncbi:branched-chain amino acid transport system permease protein [Maridesulfovibrio ferrireducens]|uniref:Branched-chain amino acid transport system permease protein n=1 Tax=Maridesulfovibrio ferrireducens TaxID=246191 RepID=A0A1G9EDR1_9BACT|nr:branched-chain amino acid ABC transporter permease [Maridesulfovibrio ferrireducens]SDK74223.1 branched-chain amino acid transport system permease protein [Maridesulfovibrio ferrireducens]